MTIELQDVFNHAGRTAPVSTVDLDLAVRRGRRLRARRRAVVGTSGVLGVALAVAGGATVLPAPGAGPVPSTGVGAQAPTGTSQAVDPTNGKLGGVPTPAPTGGSVPTPSGASEPDKGGSPPAALAAVSLPDPAPGFPIRRFPDDVSLTTFGASPAAQWVATFGLGLHPEVAIRDTSGKVVGGAPGGPEVTIMVGSFDLPPLTSAGTIEGHVVVSSPLVAGVTGHVTTYAEKGTPVSELYFSSGLFTVEVIGFGGVTTDQLVALGNALSGLQ